ncbi:hypothetical protein [Ramlibacter sp. PS4R-6]|uniref:hypothetical protein n=1 Tax=Ramlibacter sp. PS4R-6 TaxID=3133438 RepID=UPI0030B5540A
MPKGSATGVDRQYQLDCRDVLTFRDGTLFPWSGDGVDVLFKLEDTDWTFDVALRAPDGSAVVAECKRHESAVKQGAVAEFAWKVERLREYLGTPVSGIYFGKSGHQLGAVRVGDFSGIQVVALDEASTPPGFNMTFYRYDAAREKKLRDIIMSVPPGHIELTGHPATLIVTRKDGTTESR